MDSLLWLIPGDQAVIRMGLTIFPVEDNRGRRPRQNRRDRDEALSSFEHANESPAMDSDPLGLAWLSPLASSWMAVEG